MPPKGKRKRQSTGSIREVDKKKRVSLEDVKEDARLLLEKRANERIKRLEQQAIVNPTTFHKHDGLQDDECQAYENESGDEEFFTKLELLDERLKRDENDQGHEIYHEPTRCIRTEHTHVRTSAMERVHTSPTITEANPEKGVGPFTKVAPGHTVRNKHKSPRIKQKTLPSVKYDSVSYKPLGLATPVTTSDTSLVAQKVTPTTVSVQYEVGLAPDTRRMWDCNALLCVALCIAFVGIFAMESYGKAHWAAACLSSVWSLVATASGHLMTIGVGLLYLCVCGGLTYGMFHAYLHRNRERVKRSELVSLVAADAKDILRKAHGGGPYPSVFIMEELAEAIASAIVSAQSVALPLTGSSGSPHCPGQTRAGVYAVNFTQKGLRLLDRDRLVVFWEDVDREVCRDSRVQAIVQLYEGKQRRCWRYLGSEKTPMGA